MFTVKKHDKDPFTTVLSLPGARRSGWSQWFMLASDIHYDNVYAKQEMFHRDLAEAERRNAIILLFGDVFCVMEGKYDKRGSKSTLRDELKVSGYFDAVVDYVADPLMKYSDRIAFISPGNHETAVKKRHEIDLISNLIKTLKVDNPSCQAIKGGYTGRLVIQLENNQGKVAANKNIGYTHGSGGGGPVTKGTIQTNRKASWMEGADVALQGHIHEAWVLEIIKQRLNANNYTELYTQYHCQLPTYKEEFQNTGDGYHHENGRPPKPLGCWFMRIFHHNHLFYIQFERSSPVYPPAIFPV